MISNSINKSFVVTGVLLLSACTTVSVAPELRYSKAVRQPVSTLQNWSFSGRVAVTGGKEAWQANMDWHHQPDHEQIKLSGPLGQGAVLINLAGDQVSIDRGNGQIQTSGNAEEMISQELGLVVPVKFLRYWVVGIPQPDSTFYETEIGFTQLGWLNEYSQMQLVANLLLPKKMIVTNGKVKLKLFVDQWQTGTLHDE